MSPLESEPLDVVEDVLYVFRVLLGGIGIIETEVADTAELLSGSEVHADGFGVSDMEVSVGLRRETGLYASVVLTFLEVFSNELFHEAQASLLLFLVFFNFHFDIYIFKLCYQLFVNWTLGYCSVCTDDYPFCKVSYFTLQSCLMGKNIVKY